MPLFVRNKFVKANLIISSKARARNPYGRGWLSTAYLLALTSSDQLFFNENIIYFFYKTSFLNEEVNRTEPSLQFSVPWPESSFAEQLTVLRVKVMHGLLTERERISTVDLLVLTSSDQVFFIINYIFFLIKQPILMRSQLH